MEHIPELEPQKKKVLFLHDLKNKGLFISNDL